MGKSMGAWVIIALVGLGIYTGVVPNFLHNFGQTGAFTGDSNDKSTLATSCGDDGLADIRVRYKNGASLTTTDYRAVTLTLVDSDSGQVFASYTPNSDGTFATTANALGCGHKYQAVVLNRPNAVAAASAVTTVDKSAVEFDVAGANSSQISGNMYSLSFGNETNTANAFATGSQDFTTVSNTALGTGDSVTIRFDVKATNSSSQFGAIERICETSTGACGKAFVCITGDSAVYGKDDLSMSAPFVVQKLATLPRLCSTSAPSNAGTGQVAYEVNSIQSSDGTLTGTYFVKAGLGNPANTQNVRYIYMDNAYYQGSNNGLKIGTSNDANSDTGDTNRYMELDIT